MHGRSRDYKLKLRDPNAQESYKKKVDAIRKGTAMILECRKLRNYDAAVLEAAAKLLKVVPEIYTIWNFRREALATAFLAGGSIAKAASDAELALTAACLLENPKSYSTWHHRKWTVLKGLCSLENELKLVTKALELDERNFHAWNFRQLIVKLMGRDADAELAFTEEKIAENFSNYSAWHYRTVLLPQKYADEGLGAHIRRGSDNLIDTARPSIPYLGAHSGSASQRAPIPLEALDEEYDMVHQAFATDSKDQSPWMYYRWLVGNSLSHIEHAKGKGEEEEEVKLALQTVLEREVQRLKEDHLSAQPDAKWPLLTVARLMEAQARLGLLGEDCNSAAALAEVHQIYQRLIKLDPMRKGYYQDALDGKAFVIVQGLGSV